MVSQSIAQSRPIAVMVENFPTVRPQSGLYEADMVYEAPTESEITRFLAVYQTNEAKSIGPVRSARTYFADIANELGAVYAHVGGNSDALANIKKHLYSNISDADQFFNDPYFVRVNNIAMPHNVFTSIARLKKLIGAYNYSVVASYEAWNFTDSEISSSSAVHITVPFSDTDYKVEWQYNLADRKYERILAGVAHTDFVTKKQLEAKTVIVQTVNTFPVKTDTPFSIGMNLEGQGKAYVFEDGGVIEAMWKKEGNNRTRYYNSQGAEISFNRGQIWVELLPVDKLPGLEWK